MFFKRIKQYSIACTKWKILSSDSVRGKNFIFPLYGNIDYRSIHLTIFIIRVIIKIGYLSIVIFRIPFIQLIEIGISVII